MTRSLAPAGLMVLVVGAGAAYKEVLIQSGAGAQIAAAVSAFNLSVLVFAFLLAAFIRIAQGSATVAMVTAAGLAAPLIGQAGLTPGQMCVGHSCNRCRRICRQSRERHGFLAGEAISRPYRGADISQLDCQRHDCRSGDVRHGPDLVEFCIG